MQQTLKYNDAVEAELDDLLSRRASQYFEEIVRANAPFDSSKISSVLLFGAGLFVHEYIALCHRNGIEVRAVVDNDQGKRGMQIDGVPVIWIDELLEYPRGTPVIITTIHEGPVLAQMRQLGFRNSWGHTFVSSVEPGKFPNSLWQNQTVATLDNADTVRECLDLFQDDLSRKTFLQVIKHKFYLDTKHLCGVWKPLKLEYFDREVMQLHEHEVLVDGGAYTGDTIQQFRDASGNKYDAVHSFEPSPSSFGKLQAFISELADPRIHIYPYALGSRETTLTFTGDATMGCRAASDGATTVRCAPLDRILDPAQKVTLIKLDVEGAEKDALAGAAGLIRSQMPKLIVCLYHKAEDFWELPSFIKTLGDYRLVLRKYDDSVFDLVCYAL